MYKAEKQLAAACLFFHVRFLTLVMKRVDGLTSNYSTEWGARSTNIVRIVNGFIHAVVN